MNFSALNLECAVCALMAGLILADLFGRKALLPRNLGLSAAVGLGAIFAWSFFPGDLPSGISPAQDHAFFILDRLALWSKQFSLLATLISILLSLHFMKDNQEHLVEYLTLQMTACLGMMLLGGATHFASFFISLELMTVSFYILVAFQSRDALSLEAGMKYLIYGSLASGVLLYGISLAYGACGSLDFSGVAKEADQNGASLLLRAGLLLILIGLAFKISAFPFHWWTADVYEGAPAPTVALLSTGSKGIGFVVLLRLLFGVFVNMHSFWFPLVAGAAGASLLWGNLGALSQGNLKRLMGYSSISHSGFMLLGIAAGSLVGVSAILYYLVGYLLANALVFLVICVTPFENSRQEIRGYAGLGLRSPWMAATLVMGMLSLAGIPPLAGFFGKLALFRAAWEKHLMILLVLAVIGAVASFYYYFGVLRTMFFNEKRAVSQLSLHPATCWMACLLMIGVMLVGFYPPPWWDASKEALVKLRCVAPRAVLAESKPFDKLRTCPWSPDLSRAKSRGKTSLEPVASLKSVEAVAKTFGPLESLNHK